MSSEIENKIVALVKKMNRGKDVTRQSTWEELGLDSLDVAEFTMDVEKELNVTIPDSEASKMKTLGDAIDYVEKLKSGPK